MAASDNKRIYYAVQQVGLKADGDTGVFTEIHGGQSAGMSTNFNLNQVFELGQLSIYENIEDLPDVEVSLNKVLDGYPLIYHLATTDATDPTLAGRSNAKSILGLAIFGDTQSAAEGSPDSVCEVSGVFTSSLSYNFPLDDNMNEDLTLVGNNKVWKNDPKVTNPAVQAIDPTFAGAFDGTDSPIGYGGVNRRENLILAYDGNEGVDLNGMVADVNATILPPDVFGISTSGTNEKSNGQDYDTHLSSITVSTDLGREEINELGRKGPYHRVVTFPVEVTCDIEVTSTSGDMVSAMEQGIYGTGSADGCESGSNLLERTIRIATCEGTRLYLGIKNKLSSVNYSGGDAGGGNVTVTYSFTTFNDLTVMHSGDPNGSFDSTSETIKEQYLRDV